MNGLRPIGTEFDQVLHNPISDPKDLLCLVRYRVVGYVRINKTVKNKSGKMVEVVKAVRIEKA